MRKRRNVRAGSVLLVAGVLLYAVAVVGVVEVGFLVVKHGLRVPAMLAVAAGATALGAGLCRIAENCIRLARRFLAASAAGVLQNDRRPLIVYLRPFAADAEPMRLSVWTRRRFFWRGFYMSTYEEWLAYALGPVGPVVAIGDPRDRIAEIGAARLYLEGESWPGRVREFIERAHFVFLHIGESPGLLWEVAQVVRTVPPLRLVLCLPIDEEATPEQREERYRRFAEKVAPLFPAGLPAAIGDAQFLYFGADWSPAALSSSHGAPADIDTARRPVGRQQALLIAALGARFLSPGAPVLLWVYAGAICAIAASLVLLAR